jgi:hypothetical protein
MNKTLNPKALFACLSSTNSVNHEHSTASPHYASLPEGRPEKRFRLVAITLFILTVIAGGMVRTVRPKRRGTLDAKFGGNTCPSRQPHCFLTNLPAADMGKAPSGRRSQRTAKRLFPIKCVDVRPPLY